MSVSKHPTQLGGDGGLTQQPGGFNWLFNAHLYAAQIDVVSMEEL